MSKTLIIAWREFKQTVLRKIFIIAIIGFPVLLIGIMVLAAVLMMRHEEPPLEGTLLVAESSVEDVPSGAVAAALRSAFSEEQLEADFRAEQEEFAQQSPEMMRGEGGLGMTGAANLPLRRGDVVIMIETVPYPVSDEETLALQERIDDDKDIIGLAVIDSALLRVADDAAPDAVVDEDADAKASAFSLFVEDDLDSDHVSLLERKVSQAIVDVRTHNAGLDPEAMQAISARPDAVTARVMPGGEAVIETKGSREIKQIVPMIFLMLLWASVITAGQHLMMSTIEEKSNRVMEVLLSAVSPLQLMTGKILGHGAVGLLIVLVYSSLGIGALIAFAAMNFIDPVDLVYLFLYFFMAYFMIAALMAAVGSAVSDIREANTLITPVMLVLIVPLMLWPVITQDPNGSVATAFSFIPPAIPFAMIMRVTSDEGVPMWQIPATLAWGYVCMLLMIWGAAKIFRVGVLMYGKPPTPMELIKWLRYA